MAKTIKVLVKENSPKAVQAALINGLSRTVRQLNSEDYNYASILSSISLFESYAKLAATYLGMNVEVKFTIGHSSKGRVNLLNTTVPRVNIKDINAAFRGNYNILVNFVAQVEAIYLNAFKDYEKLVHTFDLEVSEYSDSVNEWIDNINELTDALSNAGVTNEEIQEVLNEAREETEAQIEENVRDAEDLAQEVWDTNKGYETASQIQEDAIKAAEEYAENKAHDNAATEAEAAAKAAQEEADRAQAALDRANDALWEAEGAFTKALEEQNTAKADYDQAAANLAAAESAAKGASAATVMAANGDLPAAGTSKTVTTESGTTVVTANTDGTYTVSNVSSDGKSSSTRTYDDASAFDRIEGGPSAAQTQTAMESAQAVVDANKAEGKYNDAQAKADEARADYKSKEAEFEDAQKTAADAQAKAQEAQNAYDDASIPYATDDELENGWDGSNNTEDDYGEDNWGDWSDIIGEGIEDTGDEGEDDSEDTED